MSHSSVNHLPLTRQNTTTDLNTVNEHDRSSAVKPKHLRQNSKSMHHTSYDTDSVHNNNHSKIKRQSSKSRELFRSASNKLITQQNVVNKVTLASSTAIQLEDEINALSNPKGSASLVVPKSNKPIRPSIDMSPVQIDGQVQLASDTDVVCLRNKHNNPVNPELFNVVEHSRSSQQNPHGSISYQHNNHGSVSNKYTVNNSTDDTLEDVLNITYPGFSELTLTNPSQAKQLREQYLANRHANLQ